MDTTIYTRHPAGTARCRACRALDDPEAPWPSDLEHTCRKAPATPAAAVQARRRRHEQTRAEREIRIRREWLADLDA